MSDGELITVPRKALVRMVMTIGLCMYLIGVALAWGMFAYFDEGPCICPVAADP